LAPRESRAVAALREEGPALSRPLVDRLTGSSIHLLGGDKSGNWKRWYKENIPIAEQLYLDYTTQAEE
jgi:hypothetical protein